MTYSEDLLGRFKRIPDTRRAGRPRPLRPGEAFKNGKPSRCCYVTAKFSIFETAMRTQTPLSFIGDLRAAFFVAQAGSRLCGRANPKDPSPACSLQNSIPRR